ncbi:deoxyribose-phosphate aldolase [Mariniflexile maritimum]|jgi:deoxyribose-phosphate aldolase|uniref:deoxyribose-phosphate aldolase n=1 Tax=Mariniflexile maritimum TaxID=2682493 RepID=UPI0012F6ADF0|nr:deoxyribose-phosphate aldolase [Mariniflexile maritimum]MCB0450772.1 deoxyribose-phosphate aldolase [Confluentibacter sp.]HMQ45355.1 deoxyribose-phosphate aldolase [Mariniflexile sp.]HMR16540.1 deoxyribose-phosphate aldolase [Mariniflexile sp.]
MDISSYIDYTLLKSTSTEREIIDLCREAKRHNFYAVCINSAYVALAKQLLTNSNVKICTVVGFPLGAMSTAAKVYEAKQAIDDGADEIEMVMNLGFLKSKNYVSVLKDIIDVRLTTKKTPLKVILEISELNKNEIIKACEICLDAQIDYIKTSSGFSKSGATLTATKIIKKTVRDAVKIQVAGDIKDMETSIKFVEAGVHRVGLSAVAKTPPRAVRIVS